MPEDVYGGIDIGEATRSADIVVALVTAFSVSAKKKSIADAHRNFIKLTGKNISRSSFWDRLADKILVDFLEKTVLTFSFQLQQKALSKLLWLSTFKDVFIYDASSIIIEESLVLAHIELKSITAQRLMTVFSLIAHNFAQCLISNEITNIFLQKRLHDLLPLLIFPNRKHRPTSLGQVVMLTI